MTIKLHLVAQFPLEKNLINVTEKLRRAGVVHRFIEERGLQSLYIDSSVSAERLQDVMSTPLDEVPNRTEITTPDSQLNIDFSKIPFTLLMISLGVIGYFFVVQVKTPLFQWWIFQPPERIMQTGEYWRFITPTFLHFSFMHILFNSLAIFDMGRRLETYFSKLTYISLFLVTAITSSILQFYISNSYLFGGLSGVAYGYIGALAVLGYYYKIPRLILPPPFLYLMVFFLIFGFSGLFENVFAIKIANWAHLGGLLSGIGWAYIVGQLVARNKMT